MISTKSYWMHSGTDFLSSDFSNDTFTFDAAGGGGGGGGSTN